MQAKNEREELLQLLIAHPDAVPKVIELLRNPELLKTSHKN